MPDWIWLPAPIFRYRDRDTGRFASPDDVYGWGLISIRDAQDDARLAAGLLAAGDIDLGEWERRMRDTIKGEYVRQYLLGRGGRDQMTAADYGSIGGMLAEQYGWLDDFAAEIAAGELTEAKIAQRADMYLNSSREAFERAKERAQKEDTREMRWNLTAAESCFPAGTLIATSRGRRPIEEIQIGDAVVTLAGLKKVSKLFRRRYRGALVHLRQADREIMCTPQHPFLTQRGWVPAFDLALNEAMLFKDASEGIKGKIRFPNAFNSVTTRLKVALLSPVPSALRFLALLKGLKSWMSMPPVSIRLNDQVFYPYINNKFRLNQSERFVLNSKLFQVAKKTQFKFCRIFLLNFAVAFHQRSQKIWIFFTVLLHTLAHALSCTRALGRVIPSHSLTGPSVYKTIAGFCIQFKTYAIRFILNLFSCFVREMRGHFIWSHLRVLFFQKHNFLLGPELLLRLRMVFGTKLRFAIAIVKPTNRTYLSQAFSLPAVMSIAAKDRTKSIARFFHGGVAKFTQFLHQDKTPLKLYTKEVECQVYNLEVEEVHHYVANGFIVHNCDDCVKLAGMGWQPTDDPFGTTPGAGATRCKTNCRCYVSYR